MGQIQFGVPEVFEDEAKGDLYYLYQDIQYVLKVPIVNFLFRTLAFYENFLKIGWNQVRPNLLTAKAEKAASELRSPEINFKAPPVELEKIYPKEKIDAIRRILFTFHYVNPKLLLIVTAWKECLGGQPIMGSSPAIEFIQPGVFQGLPKIKLVHIPEADPPIRQLLLEIIKTKHGFDAASDYRALANYPRFLEICWPSLKQYIGTDEYVLASKKVKEKARKMVHMEFPYPVDITPEYLYSIYPLKDVAGIMGLIAMFSDFLADLIIDMECLNRFFQLELQQS